MIRRNVCQQVKLHDYRRTRFTSYIDKQPNQFSLYAESYNIVKLSRK